MRISILTIAFLLLIHNIGLASENTVFSLSVRSSPDAEFHSTYLTNNHARSLLRWLKKQKPLKSSAIPYSDTTIEIYDGDRQLRFLLTDDGALYSPEKQQRIRLNQQWQKRLQADADRLRQLHYGRMIPWDQAKKIFPLKSKFRVIDLQTGLHFRVQRRAGSQHADVQPLTRKDTKIMKTIYNGRWSWSRRAVLVENDRGLFAASMNGMPHGAGALRNNFPGHFCIHFAESTTHSKRRPDPAHQLMVYKAAGKLKEYFSQAPPNQLLQAWLNGLTQRDRVLLHLATSPAERSMLNKAYPLRDIRALKVKWGPVPDADHRLAIQVPLDIDIRWKNGQTTNENSHLILFRHMPNGRWFVRTPDLK